MEKYFVLLHDHKFGTSTYLFKSKHKLSTLENNIATVADLLEIDYDDEFEEIQIQEHSEKEIPVIKL